MSRTFKADRIRDTDLPNFWVFTTAQVDRVRQHQVTKEHGGRMHSEEVLPS